jgi:hypothetical protein
VRCGTGGVPHLTWHCPLNQDPNCAITHAVGTDGGLRHLQNIYVEDMKLRGWKVVINPKRPYYPELDTTSPHFKSEAKPQEETDILSGDLI